MIKSVFVTGAAGFIGRALVARLAADGARVTALDRVPFALPGAASCVVANLADAVALRAAIADAAPSVVFHLAASRARSSALTAFRPALEANLLGTLSLVEALAEAAPDARLVAIGTAEEYGAAPGPYTENDRELPVSAYSLSKLAMTRLLETLARVDGLGVTVLRPSVCYGPGQAPDMFVSALVKALIAGQEFPMTPGAQTRDFVYVDDLVDALVRAAARDEAAGRIINIGSGVETRICDLAALVEELAGVSGLVRAGAVPYRAGEQMRYVVDATLARDLLGWEATTPLEAGLERTIAAARAGE